MKTITISSLFLLLLSFQQSNAQREFEVTFEDGKISNFIFLDEDPENIFDWNLSFRFFGFRVMRNSDNASLQAAAPFQADFDFQTFLLKKQAMLNVRAFYLTFDSRDFENGNHLNKKHLFGEVIYTHQIGVFDFFRNKKLKFTDGSGYTSFNKRVINVYRIKTEVFVRRTFDVRGGLSWYQFPLDDINYPDVPKIFGETLGMLNLGISSNKFLNIEYETDRFGNQKAMQMSNFFADFLYAPLQTTFSGSFDSGEVTIEKVDNAFLNFNPFGFRAGGYSKASLSRINLASIYSFEFGWLPSIEKEFYFKVSYGIVLLPSKKRS